jgi:hypothetical protein
MSSGNAGLVKYFLYPRNLIQFPAETIDNIGSLPANTYIMIYKGEWCNGGDCQIWPVQTIKSEEVIFEKSGSTNVGEIEQNFIFDPKDASNPFGLLKL